MLCRAMWRAVRMRFRIGAVCLLSLELLVAGCGSDENKTGSGGAGRDGGGGSAGATQSGGAGYGGATGGSAGNTDAGGDVVEGGCGCVHCTCAEGGTCVCESGFMGATCSACAAQHFGSTCQPCDCGK